MRKNLLITSALGLAAALPSLAMAEAAVSGGSVGGGCQSGFFFGVEAKGASMRLRIKKDNKADLEALEKATAKSAEQDDAALQKAIEDAATKDATDKLGALGVEVAGLSNGALGGLAVQGDVLFYELEDDVAAIAEYIRQAGSITGAGGIAGNPGRFPALPTQTAAAGALGVLLGARVDTDANLLTVLRDARVLGAAGAPNLGAVTGAVGYVAAANVVAADTVGGAAAKILKTAFADAANAAARAQLDGFATGYKRLSSLVKTGTLLDANGKVYVDLGRAGGAPAGSLKTLLADVKFIVSKDKELVNLVSTPIVRDAAGVIPAAAFARVNALGNTNFDAKALADAIVTTKDKADKVSVLLVATDLVAGDATTKAVKDALPKAEDLTKQIVASAAVTAEVKRALENNKTAKAAAADNQKIIDAALAKRKVDLKEGTEHNSSLMGGVGAVAGYRHVLGQFAVSARVGADYLWGGFRTVETDNSTTDDKIAKLGFGVSPAIGVHFLASPSAELGLVGGVRFGQLQARKIDTTAAAKKADDKKGDHTSKWIWMPFVQGEATVWFAQNISGSVFAGYNFAVEQTFDKEGTTLSNDKKDAKVKVDGIFGGFRVAYHF